MIHMPNASAVVRATCDTMMPRCGVGSRSVRLLSDVFRPTWQQIGSCVSVMIDHRGS